MKDGNIFCVAARPFVTTSASVIASEAKQSRLLPWHQRSGLLRGKPKASIELKPSEGYVHKSFTFIPDGETIVSGAANGRITAFGLDGKRIGAFTGHEADVWAVVPSPDGRYLVSGSWDQTARLWNLATRELLVTIFRGADGEWAIWTPQGYFAASPGGAGLVGWQIDRGPEKTAVYVTGTQLHEFLERPDIVAKAIALGSATEAITSAPHLGRGLEELLAGVR
jgi:WD40 repeat protein